MPLKHSVFSTILVRAALLHWRWTDALNCLLFRQARASRVYHVTEVEIKGTSVALGDLGCSSQQKVVSVRRRWRTQTASATTGTTNAASLTRSNLNDHRVADASLGRPWTFLEVRSSREGRSFLREHNGTSSPVCIILLLMMSYDVVGKQLRGALMLLSLSLDGSRSSTFSLYPQKKYISFWIKWPPKINFSLVRLFFGAPFSPLPHMPWGQV